jgi:hypothetical protein
MVNITDIISSVFKLLRFFIISSVSALDDITGSIHCNNTDHMRTAADLHEHKFVSFNVGMDLYF